MFFKFPNQKRNKKGRNYNYNNLSHAVQEKRKKIYLILNSQQYQFFAY